MPTSVFIPLDNSEVNGRAIEEHWGLFRSVDSPRCLVTDGHLQCFCGALSREGGGVGGGGGLRLICPLRTVALA